jgi:hypothetical protein
MVGSLSGEKPRELMRTQSFAEVVDNRLWFMKDGTLLACPFDEKRASIAGPALPVADGLVFSSWAIWNGLGYFSVSPVGVIAYHTGRATPKSQLTWYDRAGNKLSTVGQPEYQYHLNISPDRKRAAVQIADLEDVTSFSLWSYNLERGLKDLLTPHPTASAQPVWSPDGQQLAFGSMRTGRHEIFLKPLVGGETEAAPVEIVAGLDTTLFDTDWPVDWTPDGRYLVYVDVDDTGNADLWALPLHGGENPIPIRHSPNSEEDAAISPDGRWLAYISDETGRFEIYSTDFPSGKRRWQISDGGGIRPEWNPDGDEIFYLAPGNVLTSTRVASQNDELQIGETTSLCPLPVRRYVRSEPGGYAVGPGAERFLVNRVLDTGATSPLRLIVGWTDRPDS